MRTTIRRRSALFACALALVASAALALAPLAALARALQDAPAAPPPATPDDPLRGNGSPAAAAPRPPSAHVQALVDEVSEDRICEEIAALEAFGTRYAFSRQNALVVAHVRDRLASHGLRAETEPFTFQARSDTFRRFDGRELANVVAELPGVAAQEGEDVRAEEVVVLSAHLDSINLNGRPSSLQDAEAPAPGADDDGSGMGVLLESARVLAGHRFRRTIRFVAFNAEEQWLRGSDVHTDRIRERGDRIHAVINHDMVGHGDHLDVSGDERSRWLVQLMREVHERYAIDLRASFVEDDAHAYRGSDHTSFQEDGFPAVTGFETRLDPDIWYRNANPQYHQPTDRVATLNLPLLRGVTALTVATLAELAEPVADE